MTEAVLLRPTTEADLDFVLALEGAPETAPWVAQWGRDRHRATILSADDEHWIVEDEHTSTVGYVILQQAHADRVELRRIAIGPVGRGLGRLTLRAVKSLLFGDRGASSLWLDVLETNSRARRLYESEGFVKTGAMDAAEACGRDCQGTALLMEARRP